MFKALLNKFRICHLSGKVTGLRRSHSLVFFKDGIRHEVRTNEGRYSIKLRPGRYEVCYRVFNNFLRLICYLEISRSGEYDLHCETPKMKVRVHNLPAGVQGGMVYVRSSSGWVLHEAENFADFELDFQGEPDQFLEWYDQLGIVIGDHEHLLPFKVQVGGVCDIDFSTSLQLL